MFSSFFREERKGKGGKHEGKKKILCSRVFLRRERKGKGGEIRLIFLPKLSFQMWEKKEGNERKGDD